MNIRDEKDLLDQRNYKKIRNGIGHILLQTDRYETMDRPFDKTGISAASNSEIDEALEYHIWEGH